MKIGIISDTHDAFLEIQSAITFFKANNVEAIIHAGDFTTKESALEFLNTKIPFYGVLGNVDQTIDGPREISRGSIKEPPYTLVLGDKSFIIVHDTNTIDLDKESLVVDVIVCGNTHKALIEPKNRALMINPGEGCGTNTGKPTVALLDTETMNAEIHELENNY